MRFRTALLAATALVAATEVARAEPISTAIGLTTAITSLGVAASTAATIGGVIVGTALSVGASLLMSVFSRKPKAGETATGVEMTMQLGGDVARQIPVGRCSLKGQLAYQNTSGYENSLLEQVFVLSDWPIAGLAELWLAGTKRTIQVEASGPGWVRWILPEYAAQVSVTVYDGTQTAADGSLVANANPPGRWTASSKLTGLAYAKVTLIYNKYSTLYEEGIPSFSFVVDGAKLYDRRRDDTAGGVGPQRWDDPATWAFSSNPAVIRENYLRGFWRSDELLLGMGVPAYDLVGDSFVAAANAADEIVTKADGGTEPRYRCGTILSAEEGVTHQQILSVLDTTDAGALFEAAGLYLCQAGVAQGVVRTVTDDDLIVSEPVTYAAKRSRAELVNGVHGQFLDPASGWQPQDYVARISAADEALDGEALRKALDQLSTSSQSQAERVAEIRRRQARAQATGSIALGYQHRDLIPGDWIRWTSARFGFSKVFRIVERQVAQATRVVSLSLEEISASVYSWSSGDEGDPVPIAVPPGPPLLPTVVQGFAVAPFQTVSADGRTEIAGIQATWTPIGDQTVDSVVVQVRATGSVAPVLSYASGSPGDGALTIASGLVPGTDYEARANLATTPIRATAWTQWRPVTTGEARYDIRLADLDAEVTEAIDEARAHADELLGGLERAFSTDPAVRSTSTSVARLVQDTIDHLAEAVAGLTSRFEQHRGNVYEAGLQPLGGGGYGFAGFAEVDGRLNNVAVTINNLAASVSLIAESIEGVDPEHLLGSLTTIRQELDALAGTLTQTASKAVVDELGVRLSQAQVTLDALGTIVQTTLVTSRDADLDLLSEGIAGLMALVSERHGVMLERIATTSESASSRIDETGRAVAEVRRQVLAINGAIAAQYDRLLQAIAAGDGSNLTKIEALQAFFADPTSGNAAILARLATEEQTRSSQTGALATRATALEASVDTPTTGIKSRMSGLEQVVSTPTTGLVARTAVLETAVTDAKGTAPSLSARIGNVESAAVDAVSGASAVTIALEAMAQAFDVAAGGRFSIDARAGANGTDVILAIQASRTSDGSKADVGIYLIVPQSGSPRIVLDAEQVLFGDLETGDYPFEFVAGQLRLRNALIAPGAIADADVKKIPADTQFAAGFTSGFVPFTGYDMPIRFAQDMVLEVEGQVSIQGSGHGGNTTVRCDDIKVALVRVSDGVVIKQLSVGTFYPFLGNLALSGLATARFKQEIVKNTDYVIRFYYSYVSGNPAGRFIFKEAATYYTAVIRKTT